MDPLDAMEEASAHVFASVLMDTEMAERDQAVLQRVSTEDIHASVTRLSALPRTTYPSSTRAPTARRIPPIPKKLDPRLQRSIDELETIGKQIVQANISLSLPLTSEKVARLRKACDDMSKRLGEIPAKKPSVAARKDPVYSSLVLLRARLDEVESGSAGAKQFDSSHHYKLPVEELYPAAQIAAFAGVVGCVVGGLSGKAGDMIMTLIVMVATVVARGPKGDIDERRGRMLAHVPHNLREALSRFKLDGQTTVYAACPKCNFIHPPSSPPGDSEPTYPETCSNALFPGLGICGEPLLAATADNRQPIKPFVYQHFHDYLAGLLAQPDIELAMDRACEDFTKTSLPSKETPHFVRHPFEAQFFREFYLDEERRELFLDAPGNEGRFAFALWIDFFSAEGKSLHSSAASCGVIAMACLNLPVEIRYKRENMYLAGIIPGPKEPPLEQLNHYMRPLVDDLKDSWTNTVRYSKTSCYPLGRPTRSAVAIGVFDLPAGRKAAALAGHGAHWFCSVCALHGRNHLGRTDFEAWPRRNAHQMRSYAEAWRDAKSTKERDEIFRSHGVRWSELWRLPYWDPTRMLVVDSMHCLLEGLVKSHCRDVLDLSIANANAPEPLIPAFSWQFSSIDPGSSAGWSPADFKHVSHVQRLLCEPIDGGGQDAIIQQSIETLGRKLAKKNLNALRFLCHDLNLSVVPRGGNQLRKSDYVESLLRWRRLQPLSATLAAQPRIVTPAVLDRIRDVIGSLVKPSWLNSIPADLEELFGTSTGGSFKADEWRILFTVYIPLALISLWSTDGPQIRPVLDVTMSLVQAVAVGTTRHMSARRAAAYRQYIKDYIDGLHSVFPAMDSRTNQHMAFHIYDFLQLFGPVYSWWCFPFERLVGILQNLPNNHKIGMMESTLLHSFLGAIGLRRWLARPDAPPFIRECKEVFEKAFGGRKQPSTVLADVLASQKSPTPIDLLPLVNSRKVSLQAHATHANVTYSRSATHLGNSLVIYYPSGNATKTARGSIKYIYSTGKAVKLAVQRQHPAPPGSVDPFAPYPDFPARLYSSGVDENLEEVELVWLVGHYARLEVGSGLAIVLDLLKD